jgi:hypothetical protein
VFWMASFVIQPWVMSSLRCAVVMFCILECVRYRITSFAFCCRAGIIKSSKFGGRTSSMRPKLLLVGMFDGGRHVCYGVR